MVRLVTLAVPGAPRGAGRVRVLALVVKLFSISSSVASVVYNSNLLSLLEADVSNVNDTLVTLSVLELYYECLDYLADYTPVCPADTTAFRKFIDKHRHIGLSVATSLPIVILVLLFVVMIKISYIVITASDLVTFGKLAGVAMVDCLLKDKVAVQALRVVVVAVLVLSILQWSSLLLQAMSLWPYLHLRLSCFETWCHD
ncbi:ARM repeat superfamily protein [Actinidia rufa]|uniref:ARM repeat superfamily protein n=1 Tax=Actinidia rufa TaxID=165716 RepID=A0A7J0DSB8_9ERIC|nr:ARM repeat superfamily protein [Actinidia rufa]